MPDTDSLRGPAHVTPRLGVINETGTGLERFLHTGLDAETVNRDR